MACLRACQQAFNWGCVGPTEGTRDLRACQLAQATDNLGPSRRMGGRVGLGGVGLCEERGVGAWWQGDCGLGEARLWPADCFTRRQDCMTDLSCN